MHYVTRWLVDTDAHCLRKCFGVEEPRLYFCLAPLDNFFCLFCVPVRLCFLLCWRGFLCSRHAMPSWDLSAAHVHQQQEGHRGRVRWLRLQLRGWAVLMPVRGRVGAARSARATVSRSSIKIKNGYLQLPACGLLPAGWGSGARLMRELVRAFVLDQLP